MRYAVETSSARNFAVDLMMVRDGDRVVSILGSNGPQLVPEPGAIVAAEDQDGYVYDALVESVLPDRRVYLRISWATRRRSLEIAYGFPVSFGHTFLLPQAAEG